MKVGYCIYFGDRSLLITGDTSHLPPGSIKKGSDITEIQAAILLLNEGKAYNVVIQSENPESVFEDFKKQFELVMAGGGLIKNELGEYLFIFRRGKWDLPKGKLDEGETIAECAIREVREETGLQAVELGDHMVDTWHVYVEKGRNILKESVWFNMTCNSSEALTPQTEEDIMAIKWVSKTEFSTILENTFPSIKDVLATIDSKQPG